MVLYTTIWLACKRVSILPHFHTHIIAKVIAVIIIQISFHFIDTSTHLLSHPLSSSAGKSSELEPKRNAV